MIHHQAQRIPLAIIHLITCFSLATCQYIPRNDTLSEHLPPHEEICTTIEVLKYPPNELPFGGNATIICKTSLLSSIMWWVVNDKNITEDSSYVLEMESENINEASNKKVEVSILHIINIDLHHIGDYRCHVVYENNLDLSAKMLNVLLPAKIKEISSVKRIKVHNNVTLRCLIEGYPLTEIRWLKDDENITENKYNIHPVNETYKRISLHLGEVNKRDNGTYTCLARTGSNSYANKSTAVLVIDKPQINIDFVKAIGTSKIFFNWTVSDGNEPHNLSYRILYKDERRSDWLYYKNHVSGSSRSVVLQDDAFEKNTEYRIKMIAINSEGESKDSKSNPVKTLAEDPVFIPEVKVTGVTVNSITISWTTPPDEVKEYIHYYQLLSHTANLSEPMETVHLASKENLHMFTDLSAASVYNFQVAACNEYSHQCGPWSGKVNGTTMDGLSGPPENVSVQCKFDNISHTSFVFVTWKSPSQPHGTIMSYNVILEGNASFLNDQGVFEQTTWGPKVTSVNEKTHSARFYNVSANTNYTIRVSAVTKAKKNGQQVELYCKMPPTVPDKQKLSRFNWRKVSEEGKWMFKLFMHRISERNGPICCYRIYMVRMEAQQNIAELPSPENLPVVTYQEAHRTPKGGVYVAEMFTSESFHNEVFLGDDQVYNNSNSLCEECVGLIPYYLPKHRHHSDSNRHIDNRLRRRDTNFMEPIPPYDGNLDMSSNYTGFVEIVIHGPNHEQIMTTYSNYLNMMNPGPEAIEALEEPDNMVLIIRILGGFCAFAFVLLIILFLLHRHLCKSIRGRQRLVSLNPPDMCPILQSELTDAYVERHRDSDYGFQHEFELLPDRFIDRTVRASDARENVYKNRYPDIKAYDQTRVKLSQINGVIGSDYVNANYVLGYKERKKFICAQGPMDTTVEDFWRMIWEQRLELILMLTNLEEYSKTKCAKYWPNKNEDNKAFGNIVVNHIEETRYSDYIVRQLKIFKVVNGQQEERNIFQYHYLVWKDFMAPEYPHGIVKFIKRVNEAYCADKGAILVHCSAGVGRTGTLVALDCLIQQLKEEKQVTIFNTVCELRHQRNFLVQSLKQYIFIYRALMELAQFGDTEVTVNNIKCELDKLKKNKESETCKLQEEFTSIQEIVEEPKCCSVGSSEENLQKNRDNNANIPYDRNRVILTPLFGKEHSTYINASFIEGYDNSESFIITQDPMESTITDFWRMIAEQGVSVIIMLSEIGENKCPRYWPEEESDCYDNIKVRYVQAESCPYYTRREMFVKNKDSEEVQVTHFQYHGWPTVAGEVPEVTRGLIELVNVSQQTQIDKGSSTPLVVHCDLGADRSSLFVGLSILVQQLCVEHRVDVFNLTRKLRSQRQLLINSYAQYVFLHRAIVNYAELHGLSDN